VAFKWHPDTICTEIAASVSLGDCEKESEAVERRDRRIRGNISRERERVRERVRREREGERDLRKGGPLP
jgi:hypothetical protein